MRDVLEKWDKGISIGGRKVTNLIYADDTTLIAGAKDDLTELITKVKITSETAGLYLNVMKIKVMSTGKVDHIIVDDNNIEIVDKFIFLGVLITNDGVTDKELRRGLAMGKCAMGSQKRIFKDRGSILTTKIMIVLTLVFELSFMEQKPELSKRQIGKKVMLLNYGAGGNCSELPN